MEQVATDGKHQNTRRITSVLDCLAIHSDTGLRLVDLTNETGLGKGTLHRIMTGLVDSELVEHDPDTGRFFIGLKIMNWAAAARKRFGLAEQMKPALQSICDKTGDTVYLTQRRGDEVWYIDRLEGSYPLKALPVDVGARRPLGIGAAPLAILAFQPSEEIERILLSNNRERLAFNIDDNKMKTLIERAQKLGYALHQGEVLPGMIAIGFPIRNEGGVPFASISVAATEARMAPDRQKEIAALIESEIVKRYVYL